MSEESPAPSVSVALELVDVHINTQAFSLQISRVYSWQCFACNAKIGSYVCKQPLG